MVRVNFINNKSVEVEEGTTILEAARKAEVLIESPCNAVGTCGKCKVKISMEGIKNIIESDGQHHVTDQEKSEGYVLACQSKVIGNIDVEVVSKDLNKTLKILNHGKIFDIKIDSFIKKKYEKDGKTYIYAGERVLGEEVGNTCELNYGIVVDIGTTTLVASLINVNTGEELDSVSSLNPQSVHAQDVLSRIKFASEEKGLHIMYSGIIEEINKMIEEVSVKSHVDKNSIYEMIFSGNTCMIHLATNVNPNSLGKYPYTPEIRGGSYLSAADHHLDISKIGLIYLPPIISSYVGPDITSGVLASRLQDENGTTLFVDIGTNGEMVIGKSGELTATSTAAGPAFEGMNITYGMRAAMGAVEYFNIEEDGSIEIKTINNGKPIGICGSGLLDIVGELVASGVIRKNGKFESIHSEVLPETLKSRLIEKEGKTVFKIAEDVFLYQKDIRQVQLAKGAVRSGIEFLMKSKGVAAEEVDKVLIAGSFGYHLRAKSLLNIGLLPKGFEGKVDFIGNTSKSGGRAFLLNKGYREEMEKLVGKIGVIELSNGEDFDKVFVKCLSF
ncbi:ASKHA domain-containing protein [Clostridium sp. WILCCON 0269]|uniref:ASKHA domain-containing protein n=1 Tax=Candidatus Clostridium eludens TaxID=3381663 RepID=A0ABW8SF89_9CLOT